MLTVMHLVEGKKWLTEADSVEETPLNIDGKLLPGVEAYRDEKRIACLTGGQVYVMNANGKTVAKFYLNMPK